LNAGIAGSFNAEYPPGSVVMPVTDCFADLGIEKGGSFFTLAEAGFADPDELPFRDGLLHSSGQLAEKISSSVASVSAVTVNTTTGSAAAIERLKGKFNPDIETMEGATFFYICARENIPFFALRAISNMVEPIRTREWEIPLALRNLQGKVDEILKIL
jgi:futalosine hydrolase